MLLGSRHSACDSNPPYGWKPNVARTFPEIDIFEVMIKQADVGAGD